MTLGDRDIRDDQIIATETTDAEHTRDTQGPRTLDQRVDGTSQRLWGRRFMGPCAVEREDQGLIDVADPIPTLLQRAGLEG
jgi:hypothetical protein